jgi:hypothetical protein
LFIKLLTSTVLIKLLDPEPDPNSDPDPNPNQERKFRIRFRLKKLGSSRIRIRIRIRIRNTASEKRDGNFHIFADSRFGNSAFSSIG